MTPAGGRRSEKRPMARYPFSDSASIDSKIRKAREEGASIDVCKVGDARDIYYNLALGLVDRPGLRILDTGCYQGAFSARLLREARAAEVVGVDASSEAVAVARDRYPEITFLCGDVETIPLPGPFDYIYAMGWLHVKPPRGIERTLERFRECLSEEGRVVITGGYKNWVDVPFDTFRALVLRRFTLVLELTYEKHREYAPEECIRFSAKHYMWLLEKP